MLLAKVFGESLKLSCGFQLVLSKYGCPWKRSDIDGSVNPKNAIRADIPLRRRPVSRQPLIEHSPPQRGIACGKRIFCYNCRDEIRSEHSLARRFFGRLFAFAPRASAPCGALISNSPLLSFTAFFALSVAPRARRACAQTSGRRRRGKSAPNPNLRRHNGGDNRPHRR